MKARHRAGPSFLVAVQPASVNGLSVQSSDAARKTAAVAEAARVAERFGRGGHSAGSNDAACNHCRAGGADGRGDNDEASGAADKAECQHDDRVGAGLRYGSRPHACAVPARVCRPPRHYLLKRKKQRLPEESIWFDMLS